MLLLLCFHLFIFLYQCTTTTEAGSQAINTAVALDVILLACIAATDRLENSLERAKGEDTTAHTLESSMI